MDAVLDRFFGAWLAPELDLLGYRARPYCLGTELILEAIESPYVRLGEPGVEMAPIDLLIALQVCAHARWPFQPTRIRPNVWMRLKALYLQARPEAFQRASDLFVEWIAECSAGPEFWQNENEKGGGLTAPSLLSRAVSLLRTTTLSEERVWSMPAGLASWYHGTVAEQEGAKLRFAYERDGDDSNEPPDLTKLSEAELYEVVKADRGETFANEWLAMRAEARRQESEASELADHAEWERISKTQGIAAADAWLKARKEVGRG